MTLLFRYIGRVIWPSFNHRGFRFLLDKMRLLLVILLGFLVIRISGTIILGPRNKIIIG